MSIVTNRLIPRLQLWIVSALGWKPSQRMQLCYKSGQTDEPLLRIANNHNFPQTGLYPRPTGRITFTVADTYWQGNKLQIQEVRNYEQNGLDMDLTDDGGVWSNLHGYKCESIPASGYRDFKLRINGTSLTFDDVRELITLNYPTAA